MLTGFGYDDIHCICSVELVDLILAINHWYVPFEQVDEQALSIGEQ